VPRFLARSETKKRHVHRVRDRIRSRTYLGVMHVRRAVAIALLIALSLLVAACSSSGAPPPTASATGKISVTKECMKLYGPNSYAVGYRVSPPPPVGWVCHTSTGDKTVTVAQLQQACNLQVPGTSLVNVGNPVEPWTTNSQWLCLHGSSNQNSSSGNVTVNNYPWQHTPGQADVSTMATGKEFYAEPNLYFEGCAQPCWLPLFTQPNEYSAPITHGWPCEYYMASSGSFCLKPPANRGVSDRWSAHDSNSGDRLLVVCQIRGSPAQSIRNEASPPQRTDIWDAVAVPKAMIAKSVPLGTLIEVGPPGHYMAMASDMWFGNTGWHDIPCR
jgi:hypothetical protein